MRSGAWRAERLHQRAADIMADDAGLLDVERIHQRQHVGGLLVRAEHAARLVAVAEPAQVGRDTA